MPGCKAYGKAVVALSCEKGVGIFLVFGRLIFGNWVFPGLVGTGGSIANPT